MSTQAARFLYMKKTQIHEEEPAFQIFHEISKEAPDQRRSNVEWELGGAETVIDMRGDEQCFSLTKQGFKVVKSPTDVRDFANTQIIKSCYLPEIQNLMKREVEDAERIVFFDWAVSD